MRTILLFLLSIFLQVLCFGQKTPKINRLGENALIFSTFPQDSKYYQSDFGKLSDSILNNHGQAEFRAGVIANEMHGHLGIYAVIGVKMGMLALEKLQNGSEDISVEVFCGQNPPISCIIDGIQTATGATLGHGLIKVAKNKRALPEAIFSFEDKKIKIKLKPEIAEQIELDIANGVSMDNNFTDKYWLYIRNLALQYWKNFKKEDIFIVEDV